MRKEVIAAGVVGAITLGVTSTVSADEATPKVESAVANTEATEAKGLSVVPTEDEVAQSNQDVATINQAVQDQEQVVAKSQAQVEAGQTKVGNAQDAVDEAQKVADSATPEAIAQAKNNIVEAENNVQTATDAVNQSVKDEAEVQRQVDAQEEVVSEATQNVEKAKQDTEKAQKDVDQAQAILDGTGQAEVIAEQRRAQSTVDTDKLAVEKAQSVYDNAVKADATRQSNIDKAQAELNEAQSVLSRTQTELKGANDKANDTAAKVASEQADVSKAESDVTNLEYEIANKNTIVVPTGYADALKKYLTSRTEENSKALNDLGEAASLNSYKSSKEAQSVVISDVNNLSLDQRNELTLFTTDLLNQVRKAVGSPEVSANRTAIAFADTVANTSKTLSHDTTAIPTAAARYGLYSEQGVNNYEDFSSGYFDPTETVTMDTLKGAIYNTVVAMLFKDGGSAWGHASSLAGIKNYGAPSQYVGVDVSALPYSTRMTLGRVHILSVDDSSITDSSKFNIGDNLAPRNLDSELAVAKSKLSVEQGQLSKAQVENKEAQDKKNESQTDYDNAVATVKAANERFEKTKSVPVQAPTAEAKLSSAENKLAASSERLEKANKALETLTADVKVKQQALDAAKTVLADKQSVQAGFKDVLNLDQNKLDELNALLLSSQSKVDSAKQSLELKEAEVKKAKEVLYNLENAPAILEVAKLKLSEAQAGLSSSKEVLSSEVKRLEELKVEAANIKAKNAVLVKAYQDFLDKQVEAKRQADLADVKAKGGTPVPIVNENGVVTGYINGGSDTTLVSLHNTSRTTKVTVSSKTNAWSKPTTKGYLPSTSDSESIVSIAIGAILLAAGLAGTRKRKN